MLLAQLAGRKRLVEANAKTALGETSAALIGPGLAGGLIQTLTAPFAIALDAFSFLVSALMLRQVVAKSDVARAGKTGSVWREIGEGLRLVWGNRTLWGLAWLAGLWQFLHHMEIAVLILFATRELHLSAGAIGFAYERARARGVPGSMKHAQDSRFKLKLISVVQFAAVIVFERIGILAHVFIQATHHSDLFRRHAGLRQ